MTARGFLKRLNAPARERPGLEALTTSAETVLNAVMKDDLLASIPVVSTGIQLLKGLDAYRDRVFAAKLLAFVRGIEEMTAEEKATAAAALSNSDEGRKAGETLLLVLEHLTDFDKPAMLAFLFREFAAVRLSASQLRRLVVAVDVAFPDDLIDFLNEEPPTTLPLESPPHRERLVASGLTRIVASDTIDALGQTSYQRTEFGQLLWRLVREAEGKPVEPAVPPHLTPKTPPL